MQNYFDPPFFLILNASDQLFEINLLKAVFWKALKKARFEDE